MIITLGKRRGRLVYTSFPSIHKSFTASAARILFRLTAPDVLETDREIAINRNLDVMDANKEIEGK
jgi:hypothetical protein